MMISTSQELARSHSHHIILYSHHILTGRHLFNSAPGCECMGHESVGEVSVGDTKSISTLLTVFEAPMPFEQRLVSCLHLVLKLHLLAHLIH